jgi:hypothetical protein
MEGRTTVAMSMLTTKESTLASIAFEMQLGMTGMHLGVVVCRKSDNLVVVSLILSRKYLL